MAHQRGHALILDIKELGDQMCDLVADVGSGKGITFPNSNPLAFAIEPWRLTDRAYEAGTKDTGVEPEG